MGKPTASCFKIITCGSDSVDHDDLQTPESNVSSGRSGWSFRKRSDRHQVLNNTVISESTASADKESLDSSAANFQVQPNLTVPEKASVIQWTEKDKLPAQMDSNLSDIIAERDDDYSADATLDESSIILIQAAIRGYLARRVLLKQKNVIKLQAVVRGHLVRSHAVGTLRCVIAIVKMQALVRARHAHLHVEGSGDFEEQKKNSAKDNLNSTILRSKKEKPNGTYTYTSIEKLLSNKFARQLMESTSRTKPINIKCDPSKSDSAWKWLERWMSVSSVSNEEPDGEGNILVPSDFQFESKDFNSAVELSAETSDNDENSIIYDAENLDIHACPSLPPSTSHIEESNSRYDITESCAFEMEDIELISKVEAKSVPFKDETGNEHNTPDLKKFSIEQPETEGELNLAATSENLTILSSYYPGVESSFDNISDSADPPFRSREIGLHDNSITNAPAVQIVGSECGTELSISSTLDSPDMSQGGVNDLDQEPKILDATNHPRSRELELEADGKSSILETELSYANDINQFKTHQSVHSAAGECVNSMMASDSPLLEKNLETDDSKSSPEASPRSHMTPPESQAIPSSQVSLNPDKSRGEKASGKKRSLSADKRFIPTPNQDSATQSSLEQLQNEHKSGKRQNSFGSAKLDHVADQEPRSSNNSLPSYMQATKSARAKAVSNGSPRSSPNGRQGSPRVHCSPTKGQQNAKGNGIHSPQDRKWRR